MAGFSCEAQRRYRRGVDQNWGVVMVARRKVDDSEGFLRDSVEARERDGRIGSKGQLSRARLKSGILSSGKSDTLKLG